MAKENPIVPKVVTKPFDGTVNDLTAPKLPSLDD